MMEKLDVIIAILAAVIVAVASVFSGMGFVELVYTLVITIMVFYVIGFFIKRYMQKMIRQANEKAEAEQQAAAAALSVQEEETAQEGEILS